MVYFPVAIGVVAGGSILAAVAGGGIFVLGYVIYGLIAIFLVLIPNALAFWLAADVPFPTLYRTVANLERRWRPAAMVIVAGLIVLAFHLVFSHGRTSSSAANGVRDNPPTMSRMTVIAR